MAGGAIAGHYAALEKPNGCVSARDYLLLKTSLLQTTPDYFTSRQKQTPGLWRYSQVQAQAATWTQRKFLTGRQMKN
jgi:hypothetical protein